MFGMNPVQLESQARIWVSMFAGVAGILGLTWYGAVSEAVINAIGPVCAAIGPVAYVATTVWSLISKKNANIVTNAANVPGVAHIVLTANPAGRALESATPANVSVSGPNASRPL